MVAHDSGWGEGFKAALASPRLMRAALAAWRRAQPRMEETAGVRECNCAGLCVCVWVWVWVCV